MTLPTVGGNAGTHGTVLNAHINVGHDADGTHTKSAMLTDMEWSPTAYIGGESITFPNGLIVKQGSEAVGVGATDTVTFGTAFPTACIRVMLTHTSLTSGTLHGASAHTLTATTFKLYNSSTAATFGWIAIGH